MSGLVCNFVGCQEKVEAKCHCSASDILLCAEHLGKHLINSPGKHDFEKLIIDTYHQTKIDVFHYIISELNDLKNLKEKIIGEVFSHICKLKMSLKDYIYNIDKEVLAFEANISEIMNSNEIVSLEYLKLPSSEAINHIKANQTSSISKIPFEEIITGFYKNLDFVKLSAYQEISIQYNDLEAELVGVKMNMNQLLQKSSQENEESFNLMKEKEVGLLKKLEKFEKRNKLLQKNYEDLSKSYQDLESNNKMLKIAPPQKAPAVPSPGKMQKISGKKK